MAELTDKGKQELAEKRKKLTPEEFAELKQKRMERKESFAKRDDTVVVRAASMDIRLLAFALNPADIALRRLRDGMGIRYELNDVADKIAKFNTAAKDMIKVITEICKTAEIDYKPPQWAKE
jgi:type II secretory ATPase GspE/PulE/Tfp pilus assembly ATPase PilB-like protein